MMAYVMQSWFEIILIFYNRLLQEGLAAASPKYLIMISTNRVMLSFQENSCGIKLHRSFIV
jgi:hypothetical protein